MDRKKALEELEELKRRGVVSPTGYSDFVADIEKMAPKIEIVDIENKQKNVWTAIKKVLGV